MQKKKKAWDEVGGGEEGKAVMWVLLVTLKLLQLEHSEAGLWLFEIQSRARESQLAVCPPKPPSSGWIFSKCVSEFCFS